MDFGEAMRRQNERDHRQTTDAASYEATRQRQAESHIPGVRKALRDLAQYCEQNRVPKFQLVERPPGILVRKIKSPVGFALLVHNRLYVASDPCPMRHLELLLPDGQLWRFKAGESVRGIVDFTAKNLTKSYPGMWIGGRNVCLDDDGALVVEYGGGDNERPESLVNHLALLAKQMRNPDIEGYAKSGLHQVG